MTELIDGQTIIQKGKTLNLLGYGIPIFLTYDGKWYRVRTRIETLKKIRNLEKAVICYKDNLI